MKIKTFYILFLIILTLTKLNSQQLVKENLRDVIITPGLDTIIVDRAPGDWWFGPFASMTPFTNFYFGKLVMPQYKEVELQDLYKKINYKGGNGWGYSVGLYGEWKKLDFDYGATLKLSLIDIRTSKATTELNDTVSTTFENNIDYSYITISPSATFEIKKLTGFFVFGGFDFEIPISAKITQKKRFYYSEQIDEVYTMGLQDVNFRYGLHLGLSYDLFSASIRALARSQVSLYILMNTGTNQISNFGSNFNSFSIKSGIVIKIGPDRKVTDTLFFNPDYQPPLFALASSNVSAGVNFYRTPQNFIASDLAYLEKPEIQVIAPLVPEIKPTEIAQVVPESKPLKQIVISKREVYNFPKSETDYELSKDLREYLDALAQFLISNPNTRVIVEGHNDDRGGSVQENYRRSVLRTENVKNYLMRKGIPAGRILNTGYGATRTLVPNNTAANRAKNRRVEIIVER